MSSLRPRREVVEALAQMVCVPSLPHPTRVAVDGITASGKSTLAGELTAAVGSKGRPAVHLTMDGFHHRRHRRYRQGRMSASGYYEDAYDFDALVQEVLIPLGPGGNGRYRSRVMDLESDRQIVEEPIEADPTSVIIVDGSFLQRTELLGHWDVRIYVNTSFQTALARGIDRDGPLLGSASAARKAYELRYHAAARRYIESVRPAESATVIVDNDDIANPVIRSGPDSTPQRTSVQGLDSASDAG